MRITLLVVAAASCFGLSACNSSNPAPAANSLTGPTTLDSGVTSSNGGGQRVLGGQPNVGIGSNGTTGGTSPNQKGNAY